VPWSDQATVLLRRRTIEAMKMLDLAPNIQQGCIRGVSDFE